MSDQFYVLDWQDHTGAWHNPSGVAEKDLRDIRAFLSIVAKRFAIVPDPRTPAAVCQKCDKGQVPLGEVFYDKTEGFNTGGIGEFAEYQYETCDCCNGGWENCPTCTTREQDARDLAQMNEQLAHGG
jgi:hypothetical protein